MILSFDPNIRHPLDGQKENDVRERAIRLSKLAHIVKASDEDLKWMANSNNYLDLVDLFMGNGASLVIVTKGHSGSYLKNKKPAAKQRVSFFILSVSIVFTLSKTFISGVSGCLIIKSPCKYKFLLNKELFLNKDYCFIKSYM